VLLSLKGERWGADKVSNPYERVSDYHLLVGAGKEGKEWGGARTYQDELSKTKKNRLLKMRSRFSSGCQKTISASSIHSKGHR